MRIKTEFPSMLQSAGADYGVNRKVSNLINMTELAHHDILVVAICCRC